MKPGPKPGFKRGFKIPGSGRKAGTPNKVTTDLRVAILNALERVGGEAYLVGVAQAQPQVFCSLLGRVLPSQVTGADGGPVMIKEEVSDRELARRVAFLLVKGDDATAVNFPPTEQVAVH